MEQVSTLIGRVLWRVHMKPFKRGSSRTQAAKPGPVSWGFFCLCVFNLCASEPYDHWSFQPSRDYPAPDGLPFSVSTPIDAFVGRRLVQQGLTLGARADRRTLIRRLSLDLHGLPPTPERVEAFVHDSDPNAYLRLVDELLASPRYGERWAQHWLDVVRYADTDGYEVNTERANAWPYRDYVIQSFNEDKPYNEFVFEQLAGDVTGQNAALGFLVSAAALLPGQIGQDDASKRLARQDALDEVIVGTCATFMALTVGCARCHDHKFDPVSQRDYYAMQAFFAGLEYGERPLNDRQASARQEAVAQIEAKLQAVRQRLAAFEPVVHAGRTILMDDEDTDYATLLVAKNGHGVNPEGSSRGYRQDTGGMDRIGNVSGGRYTWWDNRYGRDTMTYRPGVEGRLRVWLSWGVHGSGTHTRDARYFLDLDGNRQTSEDQRELAVVDQQRFAGGTENVTEGKPLWSGLLDVGVHDFHSESLIVLQGGQTGTAITADIVVLQEDQGEASEFPGPRLRTSVHPERNMERFPARLAKSIRFTILATDHGNQREPCLDELEVYEAGTQRNVALAEQGAMATSSGDYVDPERHALEHINDGLHGNERSWISDTPGGGWVQISFPAPQRIDRLVWSRDRKGQFQDRLPVRYRIEASLDGVHWELVASSDDREPYGSPRDEMLIVRRHLSQERSGELEACENKQREWMKRRDRLAPTPVVFAARFREPDQTRLLYRGDPEQAREIVPPASLAALGPWSLPPSTPEQDRRVALARWLTDPAHPLTARVMVNRVWQFHFGRGIVETSSDFGFNGARPTHPQLLDWLAREFVQGGWSVKHLHRLIVMSDTYRQTSRVHAAGLAVDEDNRWLWRFPARRLEAEAIRDSMLRVNGRINPRMGGPGFDFFESRGGLNGFPPVREFGPERWRRMIYAHKVRMERVPVFGAFDCPDGGRAMPRRHRSTTALQALNLFNSPFVNDQAEAFAAAIHDRTGKESEAAAKIEAAFHMALGRAPSERESVAAMKTVSRHGLVTLCRVLYNTSEFLQLP